MKFLAIVLCLIFASQTWARQVPIDKTKSSIEWLGQKKIPGGDHKGTVKIKKGMVNLDKKATLIGGSITIDMKSIEDTDLSGKWKKKLEAHLNSPDFFDTTTHEEAEFKITKVEATRSNMYRVTGNLTLRGKTHPESFEMKIEKVAKKGKKPAHLMATGTMTIDRTRYGITYNSESANLLSKAAKIAKDKIIKNEIQLTLSLATQSI